jgi:hypothetical protein
MAASSHACHSIFPCNKAPHRDSTVHHAGAARPFICLLYHPTTAPISDSTSLPSIISQPASLIDLLLLINAELPGTAVDQEKQAADNRQDLEEVVLGKVLVRVVLVKLFPP